MIAKFVSGNRLAAVAIASPCAKPTPMIEVVALARERRTCSGRSRRRRLDSTTRPVDPELAAPRASSPLKASSLKPLSFELARVGDEPDLERRRRRGRRRSSRRSTRRRRRSPAQRAHRGRRAQRREESGTVASHRVDSCSLVFDCESQTSGPSLPDPLHVTLAVVLQVRDGVAPGAALAASDGAVRGRLGASRRRRSTPARRSRTSIRRHLAAKVDVREVSHLEQLATYERPGP